MPLAGYMVFKYPKQFSFIGVGIAGAVGCVLGSAAAYGIGAAGGRPLLLKYGRYILISKADSDRADRWFARYGAPVAFFSRLLPVIRTYISLPAGISEMKFGQFLLFTLLGSLPWTLVLAAIGLAFGDAFQKKLVGANHRLPWSGHRHRRAPHSGIAYYVYRHLKLDREARAAASEQSELTARR